MPSVVPRIRSVRRWLALLGMVVILGCVAQRPAQAPTGQASFAAYQSETRRWLQQNRVFQTDHPADEIAWNSPTEWRPKNGHPRKGILLVHGLGDSPWSFTDIGPALAEQGYLVRTILLPGHGSKPADMLDADLEDWQRVVQQQAAILAQEVPQVILGGFSTGANLAVAYALDHPEVSGLLLFSPAFQSTVKYEWAAPWLEFVKPWIRPADSVEPQQTPVRYLNTPTHGYAQYYRSSVAVRQKLAGRTYDKPTFIVLAQHDSLVDVRFVQQTFQQRFTNPANKLVWYGDWPDAEAVPERVLLRTDHLPADRISQFSHTGILFAPTNPLYGRKGTQRHCWNGQQSADQLQCLAGAEVWYSDWGYQEAGKVHARLTFNPYFDWQTEAMRQVIATMR